VAAGQLLERVFPVPTRRPPAPTFCSTIVFGRSAATTSISTGSLRPAALTVTLALEPIPRSGPEYSQSWSMWLVNGSWLLITSRKSKTCSRGYGTSMVTRTGFMYHMVH